MPPPSRLQLLADLRHAFPRQTVTSATIELYHRELADVPADVLESAVRAIIRTAEWFPTVAELRQAAAERMLELPDEAGALAQVDARMEWTRLNEETRGEPPPVHDVVRAAVEHIGGYHAFRISDDAARLRFQFARIYRELRASAVHAAQVGDLENGTQPATPAVS